MFRYAITIFLSAFLLFQVQPLIGRFILPWFGGGPSIWTACMLFFQLLLLGGYLYAHILSSWLTPRRQAIVHGAVLGVTLLFLPIAPADSWKPVPGQSPLLQILMLLLATVGGPYFLLASTGPLMQRWFSRTAPGTSPYRLYALSNVGSLLALVSYPFVFEPWLKLRTQVVSWSWSYVVYVLAAGWCAWQMAREFGSMQDETAGTGVDPLELRPGIPRMLLWLGLSAAGSVMLLATTNQLCIDVATVPFLWILPLSLYLISFIICFDSPRWYDRRVFGLLLLAAYPGACYVLDKGASVAMTDQVLIYCTILFACCMVCHGELVQCRPSTQHLTLFYVLVSAGGALGGVCVAIAAPTLFQGFWEYQIGLVACGALAVLAWIVQRTWRNEQAPAFWIWMLAVLGQGTVATWQIMLPVGRKLEAVDRTTTFGVYFALLILSLLVTSLLERREKLLMFLWPALALIPAAWLSLYGHSQFGVELLARQHVMMVSVSLGSVAIAVALLLLSSFASRSFQQHVLRWSVLIAGIALLKVLRDAGFLEGWQVFSLSCTMMSAILMEWSARGFLGSERQSLGFWFWVPSITVLLIAANQFSEIVKADSKAAIHMSRNFYGVLRVVKVDAYTDSDGNEIPATHSLTHGQIQHGHQFLDDDWKRLPTTYYGEESGIGVSVEVQRMRRTPTDGGRLKIGVVGLGTGTVAAYGEAGDVVRFYDINPAVKELSGPVFTYVPDSPAQVDVVLGDARMEMERQLAKGNPQQFDILAIDAFSSDAIPVHLLTAECSELYRQHLKPDGVLAIHISNRFLDLEPVCRGLAEHLNWKAIRVENFGDDSVGVNTSDWILLSTSSEFLSDPIIEDATTRWDLPDQILYWTDDYSGLWQVLNF